MWKLIKMDFYRLFTTKTVKVGVIAAAVLSIGYILLSLGIIALAKFSLKEDPNMANDMGVLLSQVAWMNGVNISEVILSTTNALSLFVGCIVTASFMGDEQSCGYTKNFAGQLTNKGNMAISKFVVTSAAHVMILATYVIFGALLAKIMLGKYLITEGYGLDYLFGALGVRLMLHFAINAIIIFLCTLTKSHSVAMIGGCIFGLGVTKMVYPVAGMLLSKIKINIDISKYTPDGFNDLLSLDTVGAIAPKAIIVAVVFIVAFVGANYYVLSKRDVR